MFSIFVKIYFDNISRFKLGPYESLLNILQYFNVLQEKLEYSRSTPPLRPFFKGISKLKFKENPLSFLL